MQTRSQARSDGIKLPEVHGMRKNLDPNIKPEKQHANSIKGSVVKPQIGQSRAGLKRRDLISSIKQLIHYQNCHRKFLASPKIETRKTNLVHSKDPMHTINNVNTEMTHTRPLIPDVSFHPGLTYRPPPKTY